MARVSLGPVFMWASLTAMRNVAVELQSYGSFDSFTSNVITGDEIRQFVSGKPMEP